MEAEHGEEAVTATAWTSARRMATEEPGDPGEQHQMEEQGSPADRRLGG